MSAANSDQSALTDWLAQLTRSLMRRAAVSVLDRSEQIAARVFGLAEQVVAALELTPCYPILEIQQTFARKAFEYWLRGARLLVSAL